MISDRLLSNPSAVCRAPATSLPTPPHNPTSFSIRATATSSVPPAPTTPMLIFSSKWTRSKGARPWAKSDNPVKFYTPFTLRTPKSPYTHVVRRRTNRKNHQPFAECTSTTLVALLFGLLFPSIALAQFSSDYQLSIISGVTSNWSGDYVVGSNTLSDTLIIQSGGTLSSGTGDIGYETNADNNLVLVNGPGSSWNSYEINVGFSGSGNTLRIENGAQVNCTFGAIGANSSSS